jgi:hypothetical protein
VRLDSSALLTINNSKFYNNWKSIRALNESFIRVENCFFYSDRDPSSTCASIDSSEAHFNNCSFIDNDTTNGIYHIRTYDYANIYVNDCSFTNGSRGVILDLDSYGEVLRNIFDNTLVGASTNNRSTGIISNNSFFNSFQHYSTGISILVSSTADITNNLFNSNEKAINLRYYRDPDELPLITNNTFINNNFGIFADYYDTTMSFDNAVNNSFYENESNSYLCDLDSTNIFSDPEFADTINFYLFESSPLIDAGHPDTIYNDLDGSRNDIGLWGGPYGESYEYPVGVLESEVLLPNNYELGTPYPNPFNSMLAIPFTLPKTSDATLRIFNILGREVELYSFAGISAGWHFKIWDATDMPSGIYFIELDAKGVKFYQKVVLIR